jgi:hypothetical protein
MEKRGSAGWASPENDEGRTSEECELGISRWRSSNVRVKRRALHSGDDQSERPENSVLPVHFPQMSRPHPGPVLYVTSRQPRWVGIQDGWNQTTGPDSNFSLALADILVKSN